MNVVFVRPRPDVLGQIVGRRLSDGRAEDLDDPEVERDLGDLVQHPACGVPAARRRFSVKVFMRADCGKNLLSST